MERGFQSLLLEGEYPLTPEYDENGVVYPDTYPAYVEKPEPYDFGFCQLPELRSLEQLYHGGAPAAKRVKKSLERDIKGRQRRQSISEKLRCLQKLLPSQRKMDTATMLEEASKYVKFLQAQVSVLQSMPVTTEAAQFSSNKSADVYGGGLLLLLGRLSRQQLLEVFLNSHVAQRVLYTRGYCVYSAEQLSLLSHILSQHLF